MSPRWRRRVLFWLLAFVAVFVACFYFADAVFGFLVQPIADAMARQAYPENTQRMIFTALSEVFFTYVKVAVFAATFICFPVFLSDLWRTKVVRTGLPGKRAGAYGAVSLVGAFFLGGALVYGAVYPKLLDFWFAFQGTPPAGILPIELEPRVNEYLDHLMHWLFAGGLVFLLPVALLLWIRAGRSGTGGRPGEAADGFA